MSRLINIDDSRNCYIGMDGEYETWNIDPNVITEAQPEIVRCKDCKWSDISAMGHLAVCNHARGLVNPSPNSYCNFAERRTDEQTD